MLSYTGFWISAGGKLALKGDPAFESVGGGIRRSFADYIEAVNWQRRNGGEFVEWTDDNGQPGDPVGNPMVYDDLTILNAIWYSPIAREEFNFLLPKLTANEQLRFQRLFTTAPILMRGPLDDQTLGDNIQALFVKAHRNPVGVTTNSPEGNFLRVPGNQGS